MASPSDRVNNVDHYSTSFVSIRYSLKDNFPLFWQTMPDRARDVLKTAAKQATDQVYEKTPYLPNDPRSTQHLRDSTFYQVYSNGERGGTLFLQWRAKNLYTGFHYGIMQEIMSEEEYHRTTPGTGPGYMEEAWSVIEQMVPTLMNQELNNLTKELAV